MKKQTIKDFLGWGLALWTIGYALGIVLFMIIPQHLIGFVIFPLGLAMMLWILIKKVKSKQLNYYVLLAVIWTLMAIILDYIFIVKAFKSTDYYKLDVYIYYAATLVAPIIVGWIKTQKLKNKN